MPTNNAYFMSVNQFTGGWAGAGAFAFDRAKMLQGQPASFVYFDLASVNLNIGGMLPADLDGSILPAAGSPGLFAEVDDSSAFGDPADTFRIWEFDVDWVTPANSTFGDALSTDAAKANYKFAVPNFNMICTSTRSCIPQPGTSQGLDAIGDRLMHRLAYRIVNGTPTMVTNHTVDAGGTTAGVRWYEMTWDGATWALRNKGTFAPADGIERWMASAAMDASGNLAIGWSGSSSTVYPSLYYAGRLYADPADTLGQGESLMFAGTGSQTHSAARWGDYSAMTIDPVDDCTFWYTNEYLAVTGSAPWRTRIGSFRFPSCALPDSGTLEGTVTSSVGGAPIQGAVITNGTYSTTTGADGGYTLTLPVGTFDITASAYGYQSTTANDVDITLGSTTVQDFALVPLTGATVNGVVTDELRAWLPAVCEDRYQHPWLHHHCLH